MFWNFRERGCKLLKVKNHFNEQGEWESQKNEQTRGKQFNFEVYSVNFDLALWIPSKSYTRIIRVIINQDIILHNHNPHTTFKRKATHKHFKINTFEPRLQHKKIIKHENYQTMVIYAVIAINLSLRKTRKAQQKTEIFKVLRNSISKKKNGLQITAGFFSYAKHILGFHSGCMLRLW